MLRQLISYPKNFFRSLDLRSQISKRIMWIISKSHREKKFFLIFLQSIHQVDMKNVVKFSSDFFPYFEALYTNSVQYDVVSVFMKQSLLKSGWTGNVFWILFLNLWNHLKSLGLSKHCSGLKQKTLKSPIVISGCFFIP